MVVRYATTGPRRRNQRKKEKTKILFLDREPPGQAIDASRGRYQDTGQPLRHTVRPETQTPALIPRRAPPMHPDTPTTVPAIRAHNPCRNQATAEGEPPPPPRGWVGGSEAKKTYLKSASNFRPIGRISFFCRRKSCLTWVSGWVGGWVGGSGLASPPPPPGVAKQ